MWINVDSVVHTATSGTGLQDPNSGLVFDTGMIKSGGASEPLELIGATEGDQILGPSLYDKYYYSHSLMRGMSKSRITKLS